MKFKVGDKVLIKDSNSGVHKVEKVEKTREGIYVHLEEHLFPYMTSELELYKEDTTLKTFREVIADIKEGEVWESENTLTQLYLRNDVLIIDFKETVAVQTVKIPANAKFKLKRKEYTFQEAYKSYKEGKEIENELYKYKIIDGEHSYFDKRTEEWDKSLGYNLSFTIEEIDKSWYINE